MFLKIKKFGLSLVLGFFVITTLFGSLTVSVPQAQAAGFPVIDLAALGDRVKDIILKVLKVGALNAASSAVSYTLKKFTYDTAVWLASGGKGQSPLAQTKGFGDYLSGVAGDAFGKAIEQISTSAGLGAAGLCGIPDPKIDLALRTGLRIGLNPAANTFNPTTKPACDFNQFAKNWGDTDAWKSRFNGVSGSVQQQFNQALSFKVEEGGSLGVQIGAINAINQKLAQAEKEGILKRTEGGGFNDLTSQISGQIKTPAALIKKEFEAITSGEGVKQSAAQIDTAISTGEFSLLPGALARFFADTLAGTALKNYQKNGVLPFGICTGSDCASGLAVNYEDAGILGGRRAAQDLFNGLLTAQVNTVDEYNILGQISACPDAPTLYNCRADSGLVQAAQSLGNGSPTTIREALAKGWLHANMPLLPPSRGSDDTDKNCYNRAYCYSNIKVLRQLRILPLGFEIAALNSDPDKPWTLSQVVDGFNNCRYDNGVLVYDPVDHPFCHLIDPSWVIRTFPTRCNAMSYGPSLLGSGVGVRLEECTDLSTCVGYNKDGTCINYAYCTREQNTWRFNADQCDAQYQTCRTFVDNTGNTKSYLYRTLDTQSCTSNNVGCSAYSLTVDSNGNWVSPNGAKTYNGVNTGIYFNNKVSTNCSANSAGCSAFSTASSALLYLKKAPESLKCYDADPATQQVDWPKTAVDLTRVKGNTECSQYSGVCIPDEVSCNWYQADGRSSEKIPGRFRAAEVRENQVVWNDQCDAQCVGYAGYREMPSNYSNGQNLAYIIPSSGQTCKAEEEGCSSFTNLSTTAGGVEKVENFSYLRTCSLPDAANQKNFITYEGSNVNGFQLKTFTLLKDETGAPKYSYRTVEDLVRYEATCNETLYKAGQATPDCRQFNDDTGKVYYRLLAKTIVVSNDCTPYRLNSTDLNAVNLDQAQCTAQKGFWDQGQCKVCFQGGEYRDGSCFYYGLPGGASSSAGGSTTCSASVNSCRAYKGSLGNNTKELVGDNFEAASSAIQGWTGNVAVSNESTQIGGHSLRYAGSNAVVKSFSVTPGKTYDITFWAKGDSETLKVILKTEQNGSQKDFGSVSIGDTWNYYHLGPVELGGAGVQGQLLFVNAGNKTVFLDNIYLSEVSDKVYLVKNTLKVDPICDSTPNDNLPGEALGCTAYSDANNNKLYLTNFSYLCREGAIGCTAVFDTQNTPVDASAKAYNVRLKGAGGALAQAKINNQTYSCQVLVGEDGCYANIFGVTAADIIKALGEDAWSNSTIYIPPDTDVKSPMYLVANKQASCNAADLGCTLAGLEKKTPTGPKYSTVLVKNDPATYDQTLCQTEAVGCSQYNSGSSQLYFKDPQVVGQKICAYKTNVLVGNNRTNGWFWKDVGVCSNNKSAFCSASTDCGVGNTCTQIGNQPCYPNYVQQGASFGLWSYGDKGKYDNFVGECAPEQDKCTGFIDHNDNDKAYSLIKNDKLTSGDCNGSVSQKAGCALFDEIDNPNKYWSSDATYAASDKVNSELVKPIEAGNPFDNDANIILKVDQDRECGEWLQCQSSHRVWDQRLSKWKNICDAVGRCNELPTDASNSNPTNCANWVDGDAENSNQTLSPDLYATRNTTWKGMDYDGYSLLNLFPIEEIAQVNVSISTANPDWRLAKVIPCGGVNCADGKAITDASCKIVNKNNPTCGRGASGTCVNNVCLQNINGKANINTNLVTQSCRAYPEKDAPFPNSTFAVNSQDFSDAKFCQESSQSKLDSKGIRITKSLNEQGTSDQAAAYKCECDYTKAEYGDSLVKYWSYTQPNNSPNLDDHIPGSADSSGQIKTDVLEGVCLGGSKDGNYCKSDDDCSKMVANNKLVDGSCQILKRNSKLVGWKGFCLEQDLSRTINGDRNLHPCLTWLPVDSLVGAVDINNLYPEAGYQPTSNAGKFYCVQAKVAGGKSAAEVRSGNSTLKIDSNTEVMKYSSFEPNALEQTITKQDIERIDFSVLSRDNEDAPLNSTFSIWPNDPTKEKPQAVYSINGLDKISGNAGGSAGHGIKSGKVVTGSYLGSDSEFILFYSSDSGDGVPVVTSDDGDICLSADGQCDAIGGNPFKTTGITARRTEEAYKKTGAPAPENWSIKGFFGEQSSNLPDGWVVSTGQKELMCNVKSKYQNWNAVSVKFDPITGRLVGYESLYCNNSGSGSSLNYKVTFKIKQVCSFVAETTVDINSPTAAWTNRIWSGNKAKFSLPTLGYNYKTDAAPFGSLEMNSFNPPSNSAPVVMSPFDKPKDQIDETKGCNGMPLTTCNFSDSLKNAKNQFNVGAAYSCEGAGCNNVQIDSSTGEEVYALKPSPAIGQTFNQAVGFLHQIFARVYTTHFINGGDKPFWTTDTNYSNSSKFVSDITETAEPIPKTPIVLPVGNCNSNDECIEGITTPGLTVNDRSDQDVKIFTNTGRVFLKFFGFADSDHMPLRQVKIDWGDGKTPLEYSGLYRNHRGMVEATCKLDSAANVKKCQVKEIKDFYCATDSTCIASFGAGSTCNTQPGVNRCIVNRFLDQKCVSDDECSPQPICITDQTKVDNFGQILEQTCDNAYFQFDHTYRCNIKDVRPSSECGNNPSLYPNGCCKFKPKVQIKDNWGWYNGVCPGGPGGNGCYDKLKDGVDAAQVDNQPLVRGDFETGESFEQRVKARDAAVAAAAAAGLSGNGNDEGNLVNGPWTSFSKEILVAPKLSR